MVNQCLNLKKGDTRFFKISFLLRVRLLRKIPSGGRFITQTRFWEMEQLCPLMRDNMGTNPSGRSRARLYDLNFLRYYGLVYERDADGNALDKNENGTLDPEAYPDGDMIPNPAGTAAKGLPDKSYAPEYILFDPPTPTLPGFGAQTGAEVKIGPQ
jgi:hypothetical protein